MYTFHQIGSDFAFCAGLRFFSRGCEPEVGRRLSSKLTARKSTIVHLVCVIIMYTIYEVHLALRTASFLNAEAAGDIKRSAGGVSVTTS